MKILVLSKIEGVNGVFSEEQIKEGNPKNTAAIKLQLEEANAIVRGAFSGGAKRVVIKGLGNQSNATGLENLDERAEAVLGEVPIDAWREEIENIGFDALFLHGFHAKANTSEAMFPSTVRSTCIYRLTINGHEAGEAEETAIRYGALGIPVVMVTGDDKTIAEAKDFLGENTVYVDVKKGSGWMPAVKTARKMIEQAAKEAVQKIAGAKPYNPGFPLKIRVEYLNSRFLDLYKGPGRKVDSTTLEIIYENQDELLKQSRGIRKGFILPS